MLDTPATWRVEVPPDAQAGAQMRGRPVAEARDLLGRLTDHSRAAQRAAFDIATGSRPDMAAVTAETRRDHLIQIFTAWPRALGLSARFDRAWLTDDRAARVALFGAAAARAPRNDFEMAGYLGGEDGVGPLLGLIGEVFRSGVAAVGDLPMVDAETVFRAVAVENSPAARQAVHPALAYVEAIHGRGPLWRAAGRVLDLGEILEGRPPRPIAASPGRAIVPASRGAIALSVEVGNGHVTGFSRMTPADHLLARGGALERMLSCLPPDRAMLLPVLMTIIDPCRPVTVEAAHRVSRRTTTRAE
ncbi:MAG: hypothetical protein HLUCCO18_15230 [Rhodobacteraceae bacterium HLUCCO18]|nr:MAG: hypothetical protein HLUCCO18_15230 [Rhodobacteraceae bacterium HLUCCO18]